MSSQKISLRLNEELFFREQDIFFKENNIPHLSKDKCQEFLRMNFPKNIEVNKWIDKDMLQGKLKQIYHASVEAQFEITYFLAYLSNVNSTVSQEREFVRNKALCCHHLYLTYECMYRVFERVARALWYLHETLHQLDKAKPRKYLYYNRVIDALNEKSERYDSQALKNLIEQIPCWDDIAKSRNQYSHENSELFKFECTSSPIVDKSGDPYIIETQLNPNDYKENVIKNFVRLGILLDNLKIFLNKFPSVQIQPPYLK